MTFAPGTKLGTYEIIGQLGKGAMGEVYLARDSKLKREVAIKVLPAEFSQDPDRESRFQREAEALAALNHPNIAAIYDLGEAEGARFLVMELVEGETLAERIKRGAMPLNDVLDIAKQIADALEAAHDKGFVHRDLKPANIKITPDGNVKLLDFGLVRIFEAEPPGMDASKAPTMIGGTVVGVLLGTAAYMSPEQARVQRADRQSDIWAFGCVLYEMLTGKQTFGGETITDVLGRIVATDPDYADLPAYTPPLIRSLLRRLLQKDRRRRLHDIADARIDIEAAIAAPAESGDAAVAPTGGRPVWLAWTLVLLFALLSAATGAALYFRGAPTSTPEIRLNMDTPPGDLISFAISPDGLKVVFQARGQLWLRSLDSETPQAIAGTEGAVQPFWSPDNRSVGFFADRKLKRVDVGGGPVQTLADTPVALGGAWNSSGIILFAPSNSGPLARVSATGGAVTEVTRLQTGGATHRFPQFLPDGNHFLFFVFGALESRGVYVGSLDSTDSQRLLQPDSAAVFAPPDRVLFANQGALMSQRMNLKTLELVGNPVAVATQVAIPPAAIGSVAISASAAGLVAFRSDAGQRQLVWIDRSGHQAGTLGEPDSAQPANIRLSPDGRSVALSRTVGGNQDIWLIDIMRVVLKRLTIEPGRQANPVWSPDSLQVAFSADATTTSGQHLYQKTVDGANMQTPLLETPLVQSPRDWSPDGRFVLYVVTDVKTGNDLWALPLFGDRKPFPVAQSAFAEQNGRFSPDGRWLAFQSNESGRNEVYVQPFPDSGGKTQISTNGGSIPQWRRDGRELFYLSPDDHVMAVPVSANGLKIEAGTPAALFSITPGSEYAAAADGQRFLINEITEDASPITILMNWKPEK